MGGLDDMLAHRNLTMVICAAALALTACGGGGGGETSDDKAPPGGNCRGEARAKRSPALRAAKSRWNGRRFRRYPVHGRPRGRGDE